VAPIFLCRKNPLPIWQQLHCVCTTTSISGRKRAEIKAMLFWERHVQARVVLCYCSCLFFFPLFIFSNNNQTSKNSNFLYHINNFFITIQIKKFTTIQNFFTFLYKFFLLYITSSFYTNFKTNNPLLCSVQTFTKHIQKFPNAKPFG